MEISKKEFQQALDVVRPGLAKKERIEQSTSFVFLDKKVLTYNDDISICYPVKEIDFEGAVEAEKFYAFLEKISVDKINFVVEENQLVLHCGRVKAGLPFQSEVKLPLKEELTEEGQWEKLPEDFIEGLKFVVGGCSRDASQPILTCINIEKFKAESSDNYTITLFYFKSNVLLDRFLIPYTSAKEVIKINPTYIAQGKGWIHFKNDKEIIISCRIYKENFVQTEPNFVFDGKEIQLPKTTDEAIERARVFAKKEHDLDESIDVSIEKNKIVLSVQSETGWYEEEMQVRYRDVPLKIQVTPCLLKSILKESEDSNCIINEKMKRLRIQGENWKYMALLRGKD